MAELVEELRARPEVSGLRPLHIHGHSFPGLSGDLLDSAYRGRRIALVGDSTLWYLMHWLAKLMRLPRPLVNKLSTLNLTDANKLLNPSGQKLGPRDPQPLIMEDRTNIQWFGYAGPVGSGMDGCIFADVWKSLRRMRPQVVVFNMGLRWLHAYGHGRDSDACSVRRWLSYEAWMDDVVRAAKLAGASAVIYKTTNFVCDGKFVGDFARANLLYRANDSLTIQSCISSLHKTLPFATRSQAGDYCMHGTMNEVGSAYLNARAKAHIKRLALRSKPPMFLFDDHAVERCSFTELGDGRHYHPMNMLRIRMLGNLLATLSKSA